MLILLLLLTHDLTMQVVAEVAKLQIENKELQDRCGLLALLCPAAEHPRIGNPPAPAGPPPLSQAAAPCLHGSEPALALPATRVSPDE